MKFTFRASLFASLLLVFLWATGAYSQSLIPARSQKALESWLSLSDALGYKPTSPLTPSDLHLDQLSKYPVYVYADDTVNFEFNSCSEDSILAFTNVPRLMSEAEVKTASAQWLDENQVVAKAEEVKKKLFPSSVLFRVDIIEEFGRVSAQENGQRISQIPGANIAKVFFKKKNSQVFGISTLLVAVDKATGEIQSVGLSPTEEPNCKSLPLVADVSKEDEFVETWDEWLLCYKAPLTKDRSSTTEDIGDSLSKSKVRVYLNTEPCADNFLYPPLARERSPLIFADYFPNFLIDTKREGDTITLRGQLPDKGKEAVLTLGSKEATVDGKPFTLSGAPQEIEGRLYLPYELLYQCNGVLVRWDAKKNTLWVDTRYLRRP